MLALPTRGFARSTNTHNVRLDALCDWIESSVLIEQRRIAAADVVDMLVENEIYDDQGFAWLLLEDAWGELRRRAQLLERGYPIAFNGWRLSPRLRWQDVPGHTFCLALSLAEWLPEWARSFGKDHTQQGELFEQFVAAAIKQSLPDWRVHATGWSRTTPNKLPTVIQELTRWLGEPETGNRKRWTKQAANEAGLDLVCCRPMNDGRPGIPLYLVQCASGVTNHTLWELKRRTPDIELWGKLVDFAVQPKRGFATPFAFDEDAFLRHCQAVNGLLLDRYRLLTPAAQNPAWLPTVTARRLCKWLRPRLHALPSAQRA